MAEVYFRKVDEKDVTAILGVQAKPYQEDIKMVRINSSLIGRLKDPKYAKIEFAIGKFYLHEVGGEGTGQYVPKINLAHPVKGRIRFITMTRSELLTYGIRTSEELGHAEDRIVIDVKDPIRSAFSRYPLRCGTDFPMVIYKGPRTLRKEEMIKHKQAS